MGEKVQKGPRDGGCQLRMTRKLLLRTEMGIVDPFIHIRSFVIVSDGYKTVLTEYNI